MNTAAATDDRTTTLAALRTRLRGHVAEDGIYLTYSTHYRASAQDVERMIVALGGDIVERRQGKAPRSNGGGRKVGRVTTHVLTFTVGIDEDLYLARGVRV